MYKYKENIDPLPLKNGSQQDRDPVDPLDRLAFEHFIYRAKCQGLRVQFQHFTPDDLDIIETQARLVRLKKLEGLI